MKISGRAILLDGNELAHAIDVYLLAHGVEIDGPRTVEVKVPGHPLTIAGKVSVSVYVDPDGSAVHEGQLVIAPPHTVPPMRGAG